MSEKYFTKTSLNLVKTLVEFNKNISQILGPALYHRVSHYGTGQQ